MGFLDKFKKVDNNLWGEAYKAQPQIYGKPDGSIMGAIALTEGTLTVIPKNPKLLYKVDGKMIEEWNLALVSTTEDSVIATVDYYSFLIKLTDYVIDEDENSLLIKALSIDEIKEICGL